MNSIVKVDSNDLNLPEFHYLNDHETTGFLDNYYLLCDAGSSIGEFDPMSDPLLFKPMQYDNNIPELSLEDIEEITRSLDADLLSSSHQGNNNTLAGATPMMAATQSQVSHEQITFADAKLTMQKTHDQSWYREQNTVVDALPVYATTTHHERHYFQTHYGRSVYEMTTDPTQDFRNLIVDSSGNQENVVQNVVNFKDDYTDFTLQFDNILDEANPISMILPNTTHVQQCSNFSTANGFGNVKDAMNLKSEQNSNFNALVKYEEEVVFRQNVRSRTSALEVDEIRKYFDLPITKAAKELNVGLTVLKKRCRELRIMRWPHRKIKSLQCLIDNVKEMGMSNKKEIEMLEEHKRMLERVPELELSESTKRLRQSCFKANYKKRRSLLASATAHRASLTYS
ncbi:RWP-RK domain-containing protein [Heracleum sosnowskyi]|uniref:RWP-RK domain-containing protein n=1 Tax=Heracleum sosnowskyi TaxID=360622 RepID=A0AAD8HH89_9APIA|nr:RWP-RK domain-containing protein [Heracleum sosnowskyi]